MDEKEHWEHVFQSKPADSVSWFQEHAARSLELIRSTGASNEARIIDVGGGASTLVDDLLKTGFRHISVLDISSSALSLARTRIGPSADHVEWIAANIINAELPVQTFDIWHDRAVFHFLTHADDRAAYVRQVEKSVKPGGHVIVATFAAEGPETCSGLPVQRYSPDELHDEFGSDFELVEHMDEAHVTPWGAVQHFIYCHCVVHHRSRSPLRKVMRAPSAPDRLSHLRSMPAVQQLPAAQASAPEFNVRLAARRVERRQAGGRLQWRSEFDLL